MKFLRNLFAKGSAAPSSPKQAQQAPAESPRASGAAATVPLGKQVVGLKGAQPDSPSRAAWACAWACAEVPSTLSGSILSGDTTCVEEFGGRPADPEPPAEPLAEPPTEPPAGSWKGGFEPAALPEGLVQESEWTRALTSNIKVHAQAQSVLGMASSLPGNPAGASAAGRPFASVVLPSGRPVRITGCGYRPQTINEQAHERPLVLLGPHAAANSLSPRGSKSQAGPDPAELGASPAGARVSQLLPGRVVDLHGGGITGELEDVLDVAAEEVVAQQLVPQQLLEHAAKAGVSLELDLERDVELQQDALIGRGGSGNVYKGRFGGQQVAVKVLPHELLYGSDTAALHTFVQEMVVLATVRHPNIVTFLGGSLRPPNVFLIESLCEESLDQRLHRPDAQPLGAWQTLKYALDVATGLEHLHSRTPPVVHRDLKPGNILLDAAGNALISDFGLSRVKTHSVINTRAPDVGSIGYMAPECFTAEEYQLTDKVDTWSLGVVLWEMIARKRPWAGHTLPEYYREVVIKKSRLLVPDDDNVCPMALRKLIGQCWLDDPSERPTCGHIVSELSRILKYCHRD